ncbi:MAG TPA: ATP-binding cassette domain-containing protein, partial [Burkholderiales bacterium]|nr:ATP-binding cassette domain-containing protein [Burkholderiales bacterium]
MTSENLIEISGVDFAYRRSQRLILEGIDLVVPQGQVVAVMGGSGSGKTTLLRLIGGQLRPNRGTVKVAGQAVEALSDDALYLLRRRMGMLFQLGALFTDLSVFENVAFPLREHTRLPESMIRDLVL